MPTDEILDGIHVPVGGGGPDRSAADLVLGVCRHHRGATAAAAERGGEELLALALITPLQVHPVATSVIATAFVKIEVVEDERQRANVSVHGREKGGGSAVRVSDEQVGADLSGGEEFQEGTVADEGRRHRRGAAGPVRVVDLGASVP